MSFRKVQGNPVNSGKMTAIGATAVVVTAVRNDHEL